MARIRTIKPEFFRHENLQDIETSNPGAYVMLVFAGLWGHCDKAGRFEWRPRMLKLDILPFLDFDMEKTLSILSDAGFVRRYEVDGKLYGEVVSFEKHQRINGKEAQEPEKHPAPSTGSTGEAPGKQPGSQEGKGREEEREEEGKGREFPVAAAPGQAKRSAAKPESDTALQAACRATFAEYQRAYHARYGQTHVDNAKVRSQIKQFVQRIGFEESPLVAPWYVHHPGSKYVGAMHGVGLLLADAEKLRTEWATGRVVTTTSARQSDRRGAMGAAVQNILAEMEHET